ncbi:hypothetical protein KI387_021851, partial [Taxus chinensis]
VLAFLEKTDNFSELYFEGSESAFRETISYPYQEVDGEFIQLKGNKIPKGLVSLE